MNNEIGHGIDNVGSNSNESYSTNKYIIPKLYHLIGSNFKRTDFLSTW